MQYNIKKTPKQYYQKWVNNAYQEYKNDGITKKEFRSLYHPFESIYTIIICQSHIAYPKKGLEWANSILDKLTTTTKLYRFLPYEFPDMYRDYSAARNKAAKREIYVR